MTGRVNPLEVEDLSAQLAAEFESGAASMGYRPNDGLLMARREGLVEALVKLTGVAYGPGKISPELKRLVAVMSSSAAGCTYCEAHTTHGAVELGVEEVKLQEIWHYETHPCFSPSERAALKLAHHASLAPSAVEDRDFDDLRQYFDDDAIVEITTVISLFGFLNRWNSTLGTQLEPKPAATWERVAPERPAD